jgi:hypothetical protein
MAAREPTDLARHALEQVCSGSDPSAAVGVYSRDFHDHVNAREYRGHDGISRSLGLYQLVFSDGDLPSASRIRSVRESASLRAGSPRGTTAAGRSGSGGS